MRQLQGGVRSQAETLWVSLSWANSERDWPKPAIPAPESLHAALIKLARPDHDLTGIADGMDNSNLAARKQFTFVTGQPLLFRLRTLRAELRTQAVFSAQIGSASRPPEANFSRLV